MVHNNLTIVAVSTLKIADHEAFTLVALAWDYIQSIHPNRKRARLRLMNGRWWVGKAWRSKNYCLLRVGRLHDETWELRYESVRGDYGEMPLAIYKGWREHLVALAAHELWHLFSRKPRGREQEYDCELRSLEAIDYYRSSIL
jgi:hypothetical protein